MYVCNNYYVRACKCQWEHDYVFVFFVYFIKSPLLWTSVMMSPLLWTSDEEILSESW